MGWGGSAQDWLSRRAGLVAGLCDHTYKFLVHFCWHVALRPNKEPCVTLRCFAQLLTVEEQLQLSS